MTFCHASWAVAVLLQHLEEVLPVSFRGHMKCHKVAEGTKDNASKWRRWRDEFLLEINQYSVFPFKGSRFAWSIPGFCRNLLLLLESGSALSKPWGCVSDYVQFLPILQKIMHIFSSFIPKRGGRRQHIECCIPQMPDHRKGRQVQSSLKVRYRDLEYFGDYGLVRGGGSG